MKPTVLVMAKAPLLGTAKTRLAADIGRIEAWRANRRLHAETLRAANDPRWTLTLCVTPRKALHLRLPGVWPSSIQREVQVGADLGERLAHALHDRIWVAVIGTDALGLRRTHIAAAFAALRERPFVIGPAADGGFWLLAARSGKAAARALRDVRWSTRHAAADVVRNLAPARVARVAALRDVDTGEDLRAGLRKA